MKTGSSKHSLLPLQRDVLERFCAQEDGFFLTGGAALVGFYLHHRETTDLDLFTTDEQAFHRGRAVLLGVADDLGARLETRQSARAFQRHLILGDRESVVVDLVLDRVAQLHPEKTMRDGIRIDLPDEILVNKLTSLLSRSEERDVVDVMFLERAGYAVEDALHAALAKDGGCTPGQLAFVLAEITVPDGVILPAGVRPDELRDYLIDLVRRLRALAHPSQ
ncbi:MAG: nucleotidyl transferase AbiEii/AbiGii toxin family protein [bacterium]